MKALGGAVAGYGGCSARLWNVHCQALGCALPGFGDAVSASGACIARLWGVQWQACCGQVSRTSGSRVAL